MGRDRKSSLSLVSSFSLPSLSLSRPKATPSLAPLDTSRANPLDTDSSTSSFIQPISSVSSSSVSPLKPPNSPGNSVPLPSIRSLRNRFSFSAQESPNLPSTLQTPTNKRVSSRRFLPFGNSTPTNPPPDNTPIPRKSLGDVFALGRASTSSRFDSSSARSATPSGRSSRSVTSAATMRGSAGWNLNFGLAPPNSTTSSRPHSDDFSSLGVDLGYVIAIGSGDETIRRRPDLPLTGPPTYLVESTPTVDESSQEDISLSSLGTISAEIGAPTSWRGETLPISTVAVASNSNSSVAKQPGSLNPHRLSPVPPISIPPFSVVANTTGSRLERNDAHENVTEIDLDAIKIDSSRTDFPFTPVDDRSDVTSSTSNTPHSGHRSLRKISQTLPPPLPSPSPQTAANTVGGFPFSGSQGHPSIAHDRSPGHPARHLRDNAVDGVSDFGQGGSFTKTDTHLNPPLSSALGLVGGEPRAAPQSGTSLGSHTGSGSRESPSGRAERLLSSLNSSTLNGEPLVVSSSHNAEHSGIKGEQQSHDPPNLPNGLEETQFPQAHQERKDAGFSSSLDHDLAKLLSPHQFTSLPSLSTPERDRSHDTYQTPAPSHLPLFSGPSTPHGQSSPSHRPSSRLQQNVTTPSPSVTTFRPSDLLSARAPVGVHRRGSTDRNAVSANNTPLLSPTKLADYSYPREQATTPNNPSRLTPWRSPSTGASIARKRSASFDLTGSSLIQDSNDPFATQLNGPKRADWLGPRTAKAFAAAGLLDKDKERANLYSGVRSETPSHRGPVLNSWRTQGERSGGGSIRSHSRLGSEVISPSFRTRSLVGGDSSPSYGRSSLDYTAPPSPVSTHRTLVSSVTSSSQSQQSALQALRERHELETEALLLALAGSKRAERDLRAENEELMAHVAKLEARVAMLEAEKGQHERAKSRAWDRPWNPPASSDVELLDKRRQDILLGRPPRRGWDVNKQVNLSRSSSRSAARGVHIDTPRSASAASLRRSSEDTQHRGLSPKTSNSPNIPVSAPITPLSCSSTLLGTGETPPREPEVSMTETEFEDWNEGSFGQPLQSSPRLEARHRLSSTSVTSLLPQMPGSMSMLVHEQPGGNSFEEDEVSFGSTSPSSLTLVHPRSNTPKPAPANISPITADFSFNSIPGSPRSLRLRPEEEMHLADLISLQGLEITDVIANLEP